MNAQRAGPVKSAAAWTWRIAAVVVWFAVALYAIAAAVMLLRPGGDSHGEAFGRGLDGAFGAGLAIVALAAAGALVLARFWKGWIAIATVVVLSPFLLFAAWSINNGIEAARYQREDERRRTGEEDFGDQPALVAVARAIAANDPATIRSAAKAVPDLQASGHTGKTLLFFAVDESLARPELTGAVAALLEAGADPNFTTQDPQSFALAHAIDGPLRLMRIMLDAGGDASARDSEGHPMILSNWRAVADPPEQRARLELLLDRGADVDAANPPSNGYMAGYTLAMVRASMGLGDANAYADVVYLLKRGADPTRTASDGMTLAKILAEHRRSFVGNQEKPPPEFTALCDALATRGITVAEPQP